MEFLLLELELPIKTQDARHVSFLLLLEQNATNLVTYSNTNTLSHNFGCSKSKRELQSYVSSGKSGMNPFLCLF